MSAPKTTPLRQNKSRSRRKKETRRTSPRYGGLTLEIMAKLLVNGVIATVAVTALNQLIPTYQTQLSRLEEVEKEVERTQARVDQLNHEFTRNFDPYQSEVIMQEQTNQIKPSQRHIVWLEEESH
jgi:hypothetical protein